MKLVLAIIHDSDSELMVSKLVENGFRVTRIASSGGFMRHGSTTLVVGVEADQVQAVINTLKEASSPVEPGLHRVTLFVLEAARFESLA